ncbi:StbB family protein [Pseudomonas syringae]|uniref:Stability protein StdB n=1 Tax=Pseudomonas syringae pv. actinidiae TaxID=103796 RepID=A0A2P0QF68_PSESF|nr:StbB family protein [Pseudomonas syringae]APQ06933.1 plasmid stabilization protein [Pseudomonas syringae pv. actinidiae]ARO44992.1 Stability protein StdB [Pseudomonas syringae pv. actinidiae]ARO45097.1 Stability protein StdB [Pseudomonas syringae pv. actinidiae]ARO45188.1 Stability protein StdB [Pseudomonas syringae pv. actinidiae]ARO45230.1 Stability protein StdB [Pseudomonas syringae pv. actinidiae]
MTKVAVINFTGNPGKTMCAEQFLWPRMKAPRFEIETINSGAADDSESIERMKGRQFADLSEWLMTHDDAIVDVGASNVEVFMKHMSQFAGSHEDFDYFLVPTVSEKKQQTDTINTIKTLSALGVPAKRILVVFNKVEPDDVDDLEETFSPIFGFHALEKKFTLKPGAVIFKNEVFERLRVMKKNIAEVMIDDTDYRQIMRDGVSDEDKARAVQMVSIKRLALSAWANLDEVYRVLFGVKAK